MTEAKARTHLGNSMLHERHSVMVEPGVFPRARVMDAFIFDRYLMRGILTLTQHRAAEMLLGQASRSAWAKGVDIANAGGTGGQKDYVPRSLTFAGTMSRVQEHLGIAHVRILRDVILRDVDVSDDEAHLLALTESLDFVAHRRMGIQKNPLRSLRKGGVKGV